MSKWLKETWEWFKKFFNGETVASMMRLLNFMCAINGIGIIWYCSISETEGFAHYGLELVIIGVLGKGYQDFNNYRRDKNIKNGKDI